MHFDKIKWVTKKSTVKNKRKEIWTLRMRKISFFTSEDNNKWFVPKIVKHDVTRKSIGMILEGKSSWIYIVFEGNESLYLSWI